LRCANIMVLQWPHFEMASCWTISKHPQCSHILHTCPLSYSPQRHQTHNEFEQAVYEQACHLQMFVKQHNALISWIKVNLLGLTPCCRICWKSCITISSRPSFTCFVSFRLHANTLNCTIPGAFAAISAATHGEFRRSSTQSASHVFLCWNLDTLHLSTTTNPDQADQPCILHILGIHIIRTEKGALTFSISILHWPTFSSLQLLLHQCKGPEKKFCTV
jgi:hypothetical protein